MFILSMIAVVEDDIKKKGWISIGETQGEPEIEVLVMGD